MKQTGRFFTLHNNKDGKPEDRPVKNLFLFFNQGSVRKVETKTNDNGEFDFDLPVGSYTIQINQGAGFDILDLFAGVPFELTATSSQTALNDWLMNPVAAGVDSNPIVTRMLSIQLQVNKDANDAKNAKLVMTENGYVNTKQATLAYLFGSPANGKYYTVDGDPNFIGMTPENRSAAYVDVTNHYNPNGTYIVMVWTQATGSIKKSYTISKDNGVWQKPVEIIKVGSYGIGDILAVSGSFFSKTASGFYRDQSNSNGYPVASNLNSVIFGYGKDRMNGIAIQAVSNDAWIFNDATKVFNKIVTQDNYGVIDYKSIASNGIIQRATNVGSIIKEEYLINSGEWNVQIKKPDGSTSRYNFPFREGINKIGDDPAKYGLGLTRTEHVTFLASTSNDDRIKSLMARGNGIYRMIGNVGTAQNPAILTMHSSDSDEEISSLIAVDMYRNRVSVAFRLNRTAPVVQGDFYTTLNTTVDSNGNIKKASPIIKLFHDRIEWNQDFKEPPILEKIATGTYKISNTHGLSRDGWTYEKPKNKDGNYFFKIRVQKLDDGCIITVHDYYVADEEVEIIDEHGNARMVKKQVEVFSMPRDIKPEERWIDLRFHEQIYTLTSELPKLNIPYRELWGVEPYIPPIMEQIEDENIAFLDQRAF